MPEIALAYLVREWLRPEPTRPAALQAGRFVAASGRAIPITFSCGVHEGRSLPATPRCESAELARFRSILADARAVAEGSGMDLVIAFVPTKFRVYRDLCSFAPGSPCRGWPVDDLPGALESVVGSIGTGLGFLDLTPGFRAEAGAGGLVYLADDTHWSAEGHRLAARVLGDFLDRRLRLAGEGSHWVAGLAGARPARPEPD